MFQRIVYLTCFINFWALETRYSPSIVGYVTHVYRKLRNHSLQERESRICWQSSIRFLQHPTHSSGTSVQFLEFCCCTDTIRLYRYSDPLLTAGPHKIDKTEITKKQLCLILQMLKPRIQMQAKNYENLIRRTQTTTKMNEI